MDMVCIYCGGNTQVSNSRLQKRNNSIWRRRSCQKCSQVFTTIEQADLAASIRVIDAGSLKPYNRDQLLMNVYEACKHRMKPAEDAQALVLTITADIVHAVDERGTISQDKVSEIIKTILQRFDPVAATVYAAYNT